MDINDMFAQHEQEALDALRKREASGEEARASKLRAERYEAETARLRAHGCIYYSGDEEE